MDDQPAHIEGHLCVLLASPLPRPSPCCRNFSAAVTSGLPEANWSFKKKKKSEKVRFRFCLLCQSPVPGVGDVRLNCFLFSAVQPELDSISRNSFGSFMQKEKKKWLKNGGLIGTLLPFQSIKMT